MVTVDATPLDTQRKLTKREDSAFPLRWGILGAGNISRQGVLSARACTGASITAVGTRDLVRSQDFARKLNIPIAHGSYQALVNDPNVDIIYVGTITRLHKEHSLLAINAGKHVLCEKPLATSLADAKEMYAAAETKGVMLQDAMWTRFFPAVEHARSAIENGEIGEPLMVHSDFFDPIYVIQTAPLAFGKEAEVTGFTYLGRRASCAIVEYGEGRCAVLSFPPFNSELPETTQIFGTGGRLVLGRPSHCPTELTIHRPLSGQIPSMYRSQSVPAPVSHYEYPLPHAVSIPSPFPNQHGFLYQAEAVHRCLANGILVCPQYDTEDSLHSMGILERVNIARSSR